MEGFKNSAQTIKQMEDEELKTNKEAINKKKKMKRKKKAIKKSKERIHEELKKKNY